MQCALGCLTCSSYYVCNTCEPQLNLTIRNYFYGLFQNTCNLCTINCYWCLNSTFCSTCSTGYTVGIDGKCYPYNQSLTKNYTFKSIIILEKIVNSTTFKSVNTFPSVRAIVRPLLCFMISFDDLFPYMYHERNYGRYM